MKRRLFLKTAAISTAVISSHSALFAANERRVDLVIIGGSLGGCAAALAALRNGLRVVMTEESPWIGGQCTSQSVPPDENPWIETTGAPESYHEFRRRVREYYIDNYPLKDDVNTDQLNPGGCGVSKICHEPRVSLAVLNSMLAPYRSNNQLTVYTHTEAVNAETDGDRITAVTVRHKESGMEQVLSAPYFLDATETGDLLPLSGTEFVTGAEAQSDTGEMHAASEAQPDNMQAVTWCFAMDYIEGADNTIDKPENYEFWRDHVPDLQPDWPGKLLSWTYTHPYNLEPITRYCEPIKESQGKYNGFWHYRRMINHSLFEPGFYPFDICLVNWPQNDYMLGNLFGGDAEENQKHYNKAKELSYALFYWMQTEAPRMDGGTGWKGLRLRGDIAGTDHGLAMRPYIREARRIKPEFRVLEQHVGTEMRMEETGLGQDEVNAASFHDSVGVGYYRIDLHPSTGGDNYIDLPSLPFEIPLGALIPERMENLIPACKNIGTTHITNGCYRLHPVEWNIGESAGALVAYCLKNQETPREVRNTGQKLEAFQSWIQKQGVVIRWPDHVLKG